jgi:hypothetical protein
MAYDDVRESVDECVCDYVKDNLIDEIVDELISQATESDEFHFNPEEMFGELDVEEIFSDIIDQHEDDIQNTVQDAFYNETIYDDDCFDIIKEYGFDSAVEDYYKGLELSNCSDVAYHILMDNISAKDVEYDDYFDDIFTGFVGAWRHYTLGCCMLSIQDADKQLTNLLFTKVVYNDDYIRFYKISSDCEFKLTFDMCLVTDSIKIKLDFIRRNEYDETLDFYSNGVMIASVEY